MDVAEINMTWCGSTGDITFSIADCLRKHGISAQTYSPHELNRDEPSFQFHHYYGTRFGRKLHNLFGRITGLNGLGSVIDTIQLIQMLKKKQTDVLHLHNLHSYCINFPILFRYIKKNKIKVFWTLHDCWTFTGHCPHYAMIGCDRWKRGCHHCPQKREYPQSLMDSSRIMYRLKKRWFCGVENLTFITPSNWLSNQVKQSFLTEYPTKIICNGIDLSLFCPTPSCFREKEHIAAEKKIVLGVAFGWTNRKGLDVFVELEKRLPAEKYQIVLVGTDEGIDKQLPKGIISIHRTKSKRELAEIYTAANVFANPTREDTFPTVNMEALACGTPVITFDTGGSPEIIDANCGRVVECDNIGNFVKEIIDVCENEPFDKLNCLRRAKKYDREKQLDEYFKLFAELGSI